MSCAASLLPCLQRAVTAFGALALGALALPAFAQATPPSSSNDERSTRQDANGVEAVDARIVTQVFDESAVVTIRGKAKVLTTVMFSDDERIENIGIGDSAAWQVQPNKAQTQLFVKPLAIKAQTNMTVVTNKRTYLFDLVASPRNSPIYVMQFRYPKLEKEREEARLAAEAAANQERATQAEMTAARDPFAVQDPALQNFEWAKAGESDLLPTRVFDNGQATFLTWPADSPIPAILILNEDGDEGPVNQTARGETIVLDTVPMQIVLRSGKESATLTYMGPSLPGQRNASISGKKRRGS